MASNPKGFCLQYNPNKAIQYAKSFLGFSWGILVEPHDSSHSDGTYYSVQVVWNKDSEAEPTESQLSVKATLTLRRQDKCDVVKKISLKNNYSETMVKYWEDREPFKVFVHVDSIEKHLNLFSTPNGMNETPLDVNGKTFYVDKHYLSVHSPFFAALFTSRFLENNANRFKLSDINHGQFLEILHVLYPMKKHVTKRNFLFLLKYGDRYQMESVLNQCEDYLMHTSEVSNSDKVVLANQCRLEELKTSALLKLTKSEVQALRSRGIKNLSNAFLANLTEHNWTNVIGQ